MVRRKVVKKKVLKEQTTFSVEFSTNKSYLGGNIKSRDFTSALKARRFAQSLNKKRRGLIVIQNRFLGKPSKKTFFKDRQLVMRDSMEGGFGLFSDIKGNKLKKKR